MSKSYITILMITLFLSGCSNNKQRPVKLSETYIVKKQNLLDQITLVGTVTPVTKIELMSEASGLIEEIHVHEGQLVKKGECILRIAPVGLLFRRDKIKLEVKKAKLMLEKTKRRFLQAKELTKSGTTTPNELWELENQYNISTINHKQSLLELRNIEQQLIKTKVISPISGVLTSLDVEEGEIAVSATSGLGGKKLGTIADVSSLEVVTQISCVDYRKIKINDVVTVNSESSGLESTTGKISFIGRSAQRENKQSLATFKVRILLDSLPAGFAPGMDVSVNFTLLKKNNVIAVPNKFIKKNNGVFEVTPKRDNGTAQQTVVRTGETDFRYTHICEGLFIGDTLIFHANSNGTFNAQ